MENQKTEAAVKMIGDQVKALAISAGGLPQKQETSNVQRVLDQRMTLSEAIEAATAIVDCYPNGGRDAGKGYLGALAAILGKYPRSIALKCADPLYGITFECKFLPTVADIVTWCERRSEPLYRDYEREKRIAAQLAERAHFDGQQKQKPSAPPRGKRYSYGEFLEWAKENNKPARAIGAFDPGGYLGPELADNGEDKL